EWAPEWTGTGRVGEWLRNIKDWAISRERYWGTPLPVWICESCGHQHCIGSIEEMNSLKTETSPTPKELHRPYVDDVKLCCPAEGCKGEMVREPYVMDCWFDSGCASFAQWHYPFENKDKFENSFPVDYICEAVDQTRGWFYSLLAVSTTVFDSISYRRCLSLGHILDNEGKKMSKSRGNVVNPWDHFNKEGTDAIRWYMTSQSAPWNPMNFDPNGVRETYAKMFLTLWNVHKFHLDYAILDNFDYGKDFISVEKRTALDRWILSRMSSVAEIYHNQYVSWEFHKAARELENFVINDLSNWYVRRSRRRLWDEAESHDKLACQSTLYEVLTTVSKLMAPIAPFMPDKIHFDLTGTSVHTADWPLGSDLVPKNLPPQDLSLEKKMSIVRTLAETGRKIRVAAKRRQRLPCKEGWIVGGPKLDEFHSIIAEELNVETLTTEKNLDRFQKIEVLPNHKVLGAKCRADLPKVLAELSKSDPDSLLSDIESGVANLAGFEITLDDINIKRVEKEGYAASTFEVEDVGDISLVLDVEITETLVSKGLAREITRRIQSKRKDLDLDLEASISLKVCLESDSPKLNDEDWEYIKSETRSEPAELIIGDISKGFDSFQVEENTIYFKVN
ncbi:MAG: class I tRNA ligase family protein, partial [Candidatus Thermoplasmatota archaeon]|nr:class I tRNA ligase family protein [Candidatus Thermoplasmatota archaeon]